MTPNEQLQMQYKWQVPGSHLEPPFDPDCDEHGDYAPRE
jgi:hypothetical protein